jgi:hypothetical protein
MKNPIDTIGNRTLYLQAVAQCLTQLRHNVPQVQKYITNKITN